MGCILNRPRSNAPALERDKTSLNYLAVAKNVGEWVAEQRYRGLEWIRGSNAFYTVLAGVAALMIPCVASNLVRILGIGILQGLLALVGSVVTFVVASIGLGAVLLTRGGRIRPYAAYYEFEEGAWAEESYSPTEDEIAHSPETPEKDEEEKKETSSEEDEDKTDE